MRARPYRSRVRGIVLVLLAVLAVQGCAYNTLVRARYRKPSVQKSKYKKVALLLDERVGTTISPFEHLFMNTMAVVMSKRGYNVVERVQAQRVLQEQVMISKDFAALTDAEKVRRLGRVMNLDAVFFCTLFGFRSYVIYQLKPWLGTLLMIPGPNVIATYLLLPFAAAEQQRLGEGEVFKPKFVRPWLTTNAGVSIRGIDVATGEIIWINFTGIDFIEKDADSAALLNDYYSQSMTTLAEKLIEDFERTDTPPGEESTPRGLF